jgi:hypothetical protein
MDTGFTERRLVAAQYQAAPAMPYPGSQEQNVDFLNDGAVSVCPVKLKPAAAPDYHLLLNYLARPRLRFETDLRRVTIVMVLFQPRSRQIEVEHGKYQ